MSGFFDSIFGSADVPGARSYDSLINASYGTYNTALNNNTTANQLSSGATSRTGDATTGYNTALNNNTTANAGYTAATGQLGTANQAYNTATTNADQYNDWAAASQQLMRDQFDWARQTYAENRGVTNNIVNSFLNTQNNQNQYAAEDRARYQNVFQGQEDALVNDANSYNSEGRRDLMRGRAEAAVAQNFEAQRQNTMRDLESYGINPGSVRYAGLDGGIRAQQAAAQAAAGSQADLQTEQTARDLRAQAIALGQGTAARSGQESALGLQAGTAAGNTALAQTASGASILGTAAQYGGLTNQYGATGLGYTNAGTSALNAGTNALNSGANYLNSGTSALNSGANYLNSGTNMYNAGTSALNAGTSALGAAQGGLSAAGSLQNTSYQNQMAQYNADQAHSSGIGSLLGTAASIGTMFLNEGGEVNRVPKFMSPSGGEATDDVPARLTAGEFVMPKDVTAWYGEDRLQKMIEKARQAKGGAKAKPQFALPRG